MPFILRNVRLQGVDSVMTPAARRAEARSVWCATCLSPSSRRVQPKSPSAAPEYAGKIMDNQFHGRALVKIA